MFTVALAKGALLKESVSMFSNIGIDFSAVLEDSNRQLMVPSVCGRAKALLVVTVMSLFTYLMGRRN